MAVDEIRVNTFGLVAPIAKMVDLMSPPVGDHHMRVAYLAFRLAEELGLPAEEIAHVAVAGTLHDIGAFSLQERLDLLGFEEENPGRHSRAGYLLLKNFKPFEHAAEIVRYHHTPWAEGEGAMLDDREVPGGSHIIHLADRATVRMSMDRPVLGQVPEVCCTIEAGKDHLFVPEHVKAFLSLARRDYIWLEATAFCADQIIDRRLHSHFLDLDMDDLLEFSMLLCILVDFKSEFTATHSCGVSAGAVALAGLMGFSAPDRKQMEIAGYLHDLGKLAIPSEIIEKPDKLTDDEWFVMRSHAYYTHMILEGIASLKTINKWGGLHQERINGTGYPFGLSGEDIPLGARIMAVADVFTALTEDRPYRRGLDRAKTAEILKAMARAGHLDRDPVQVAEDNFDTINKVREEAQQEAAHRYKKFQSRLAD